MVECTQEEDGERERESGDKAGREREREGAFSDRFELRLLWIFPRTLKCNGSFRNSKTYM